MSVAPVAIFPPSHPARLRAFAAAHGIGDAALAPFHYLEIGCGDGHNLLPLAARFVAARFSGVDEPGAISQAIGAAARSAIENIAFATEAPEGRFDYIHVRRRYCELTPEDQDALLAAIARLLASQGVALIAYEVLPGWALRRSLRQLLSGGDRFSARARLKKIRQRLPESRHAYPSWLRAELELANSLNDDALMGELLAPSHEPIHFGDFAERAEKHGLLPFAEALPATPDGEIEVAAIGEVVRGRLSRAEAEASLDLLSGRPMRATLLCRTEARPAQSPDWRRLSQTGYFAGRLAVQAEEPLFGAGEPLALATDAGAVIEAKEPLLKAALVSLSESWPRGQSSAALVAAAREKLDLAGISDANVAGPAASARVIDDLVALVHRRQIELCGWTPDIASRIESAPRLRAHPRVELERGPVLTTARHEPMRLDAFHAALAALCDGTRALPDLIRAVSDRVEAGALDIDGLPLVRVGGLDADVDAAQGEPRLAALGDCILAGVVRLRDLGLMSSLARQDPK